MSKAGQSTFTGVSEQADVTLLHLLRAGNAGDFKKAVIEGNDFADFGLIYGDRIENCEVKAWTKPLDYSDVRKIVQKHQARKPRNAATLVVIARAVSNAFRNDYDRLRRNWRWLGDGSIDRRIRGSLRGKFSRRGWTEAEIELLATTRIIEYQQPEFIQNQIFEFFALDVPFFLDKEDVHSLASRLVTEILKRGSQGRHLTRGQLLLELERTRRHIADKSESFPPHSTRGKLYRALLRFLQSERSMTRLWRHTYLTPVSSHPFLIFCIVDALEKNSFEYKSFRFFLESVLLKQRYAIETMRLVTTKYRKGDISDAEAVEFVLKNYKRLIHDFNHDDALQLLLEISKKDSEGKYDAAVLRFVEKDILGSSKRRSWETRRQRGWREHEHVSGLLKAIVSRARDKDTLVDFIFRYFDFTGDDFDNLQDTPSGIYSLVVDYMKEAFPSRYQRVLQLILGQFDETYGSQFKGYEIIGTSISQRGNSFSITDKGVVRCLFSPFFLERYKWQPDDTWRFIKSDILDRATARRTPLFLKRAVLPVLIARIDDAQMKRSSRQEAWKYLRSIIRIEKGVPPTSDIVFEQLRHRDLKATGLDEIFSLIQIDAEKYPKRKYRGYPTSVIVMSTVIRLIKAGHDRSKTWLLELARKPGFKDLDNQYHTFELLLAEGVVESDLDFIAELLDRLNFKEYLNSCGEDVGWEKGGILGVLAKRDWQTGSSKAKELIDDLLEGGGASEEVLKFITAAIRGLAKANAVGTYALFKPYLVNKTVFRGTFRNGAFAREQFVWIVEQLVQQKHISEAKHIINLCVDDPDPDIACEGEWVSYHARVKNGREESTLSSVRGVTAWILRHFAGSKDPRMMKFAFDHTKTLLDLDGGLSKRLGYAEADFYVRQQALHPFGILCNPWRRRILNEHYGDLGGVIKDIAFQMLKIAEKGLDPQKANEQTVFSEYLLRIFCSITDIGTAEAGRVWRFLERAGVSDACRLFVYYAVKRESQWVREGPKFNSVPFKTRLRRLCRDNPTFRQALAWYFWSLAEGDAEKKEKSFDEIEGYWRVLFCKYDHKVFQHLYKTLERTLARPEKYSQHKMLLKSAIETELAFYRRKRLTGQLWEPDAKIFEILKEHGNKDFLEILYSLVSGLNERVHYVGTRSWIQLFRQVNPASPAEHLLYKKTERLLRNLYPDQFKQPEPAAVDKTCLVPIH